MEASLAWEGSLKLHADKIVLTCVSSDVGGSLRIPAHFSGICSLKPSYHRLSHRGTSAYKPTGLIVNVVSGPMAARVADLDFFCRAAFGHAAPDVLPLKYQEVDAARPLRFGYCASGPFMEVSPLCRRAVLGTVRHLRAAGHNVVEFTFPENFQALLPIFYEIMSADGWRFYLEKLRGERREANLKPLLSYAAFPNWIKTACSWIFRLVCRDARAASVVSAISAKDAYQLIDVQQRIEQIDRSFREAIDASGIDVLLTPVHALPATPHDAFPHIHFCAVYTFAWNMLNQPIGVLPAAYFDKAKDVVPGTWPRHFSRSNLFSPNLMERAAQQHYHPKQSPDLPAGVQIVGRTNEDEKVLHAMFIVEEVLKTARLDVAAK